MRLRTSVIAIIVIVLVSVGGLAMSSTRHDARAPLAQALDMLPANTRVAGFTDWALIRSTLGFDHIATAIDRDTLVGNAFKRDLSARSILEGFTETMVVKYGWSIADLRWEMYGQATAGSVLVAGMNDDLKVDKVTAGLRKLGYDQLGGVWTLGVDRLSLAVPGMVGTMSNVAVLDGERLILASDNASYLLGVLAMHGGQANTNHGKSLAGVVAARQTATPLIGAQSAEIQVRKDACKATGLADEPASVRAQGRNTVEPLGALAAVSYGARGIFDRGGNQRVRFSMTFGSAILATRQAALRSALTTGPFIGRTGQITDVLTLTSTHTTGPNVTLDFDVDADKGAFMNGVGPLLFAACSS